MHRTLVSLSLSFSLSRILFVVLLLLSLLPVEIQQQYSLQPRAPTASTSVIPSGPPPPPFYEAGPPPPYPFEICISLPPGFTGVSYKGRSVFIDHLYRRTLWHWEYSSHVELGRAYGNPPPYPSPQSQSLPAGWEILCDAAGRTYLLDHNVRRTFWSLPGVLSLCIQELLVNQQALATASGARYILVATVGSEAVGHVELPQDGSGVGLLPTWQVPLAGLAQPLVLSLQSVSPITGTGQSLGSGEIQLVDLDGRSNEAKVVEVQLDNVQHRGGVTVSSGGSTPGWPVAGAGGEVSLDDWVDIAPVSFVKARVAVSYANSLLPS